ncbi:TatD family hydrolase [Segniliparus rugosus]|uniref:TatD family hydrolase n=1 Tax=Segniliparus rugosus (strain ATCC BAA-974 / DSM 45345 / CCUG 50838 / CIP 108380 / JCM 13579 / CDC 945) TaxID=679197 RepID=E5XLA2_SEGRC|nr:TatD family hydrolase [Segniliparus rugosus]EFV14888.1 TatD family hydrolase [Segniliparus rugosus ATCC BAA-974]
MAKSKSKEPPPPPEPVGALVDAHTHLDACGARDAESVGRVLDRAEAVGVGRVVTVADGLDSAEFAVSAAHWDPRVWAAVAVHPSRANVLDEAAKTKLEALARDPRTVAVGETGLEWFWIGRLEGCASKAEQFEAFRWHIDLAKRVGKPLMIHNREADEDLLAALDAEGAPEAVIMHCFSSDAKMARECVDRGYVLSFSGTVSFSNAASLREAAPLVPDGQLLVETDAPFLTPHPYRGAPNESYCLPYTVAALAALRGVEPAQLAETSTATAERVYGLGAARTPAGV